MFAFIFLPAVFYGPAVRAEEKVVLQLRWDPQFQFAGYYAALWQGYYKEAGFDVEIKPAWINNTTFLSATNEVNEGRADYGVGASDILIANDTSQKLKLLSSFFQRSAVEIYVNKKSAYSNIADFQDLKVFRIINDIPDIELQSILRAEGIDPSKIEPVQGLTYGEAEKQLVTGEIDALAGYSIATPFRGLMDKSDFHVLRAEDYGIAFYGDSLFTHQRVIDRDQDAVERFIEASKKGWVYALENPTEISRRLSLETLHMTSSKIALPYNLFQAQGVRQLMLYPNVDVGNTNPARWQKMHSYLKSTGLVKNNFDDKFIFDPDKHRSDLQIATLKVAGIFIVSSLILLFIFYSWNKSLRREVFKRTNMLARSERKYKNLVENQSLLACQWLPDTTITYANEVYSQFYGIASEDIIGQKFSDFYSSEVSDALIEHFQSFTPENPSQSREDKMMRSDGKERWCLWQNEAAFDSKGDIVSFQSFGTDITEIKDLEQQLIHAKKMEVVGQLTGGIAHDFNNLLQVIQMNLELANRKITDNQHVSELLGSAIVAGERGRALIQQLMAFSRKQTFNNELINPNEQVTETVKLLSRTMSDYMRVEIELDPAVGNISADLGNFQNALVNLAVNSREAILDGGVLRVITKAQIFEEDKIIKDTVLPRGDYIEILVIDDGVGMSPDVLDKATEPYFTTRDVGKGSGLGLSTVYGFTRQSKGALVIESELGQGTTVKMILPVAGSVKNSN